MRQDFNIFPPKMDGRFRIGLPKCMGGSVLAFLKCTDGSVWTHLNCASNSVWYHFEFLTHSSPTRFPHSGNSVDHCQYARKATKQPTRKRMVYRLIKPPGINIHKLQFLIFSFIKCIPYCLLVLIN